MYDNKRRFLILLLLSALIFSLFTVYVSSKNITRTSAKAAALYVPETDSFLYTKNSNEKLPMASTTKIMTALIAIEELDSEKIITVAKEATGIEGSSIYLKPNEQISALDLIYALILQSANDAAAAIAYEISGGISEFSILTNERAAALGLTETNFTNPHGLDDKDHYTSAHDLAIISAQALKNENFKKISSTYKKEIITSESKRTLVNHNKLLKTYDGCIGVKTGYTKKSGRSLVSAAERNGLTLIAVTIDAPDDWNDHTAMLDYGFSLIESRLLAFIGEYSYNIPVLGGDKEFVNISNEKELRKIILKAENQIDTEIKLPRYIAAPVKCGDILGKVIFTKNGDKIAELDIKASETVNKEKRKSIFGK